MGGGEGGEKGNEEESGTDKHVIMTAESREVMSCLRKEKEETETEGRWGCREGKGQKLKQMKER